MLRFPAVRATRLGLAAAAILVTSPRASGAQTPTFPSQVELVTVDAIVLDEKGRAVRGLTREDFTLSEDGKLQEIVSFEAFDGAEVAEEAPFRASPVASNTRAPQDRAGAFVLLVDDLGIDARRLPRLLKALSGVLQSSFRAGDEVTLATASGSLWWGIRFPEGRDDLPFLLERATSRRLPELGDDYMADYEAYQIAHHERLVVGPDATATELPAYLGRVVRRWMGTTGCLSNRVDSCAHTVQARATERDSERRARTLAILAALERAVFSLTGVRGRKELLLFSDGFVYDRGLPEVRQVAGICREANVVVSFLDARGSLPALPETQAVDERTPGKMRVQVALELDEATLFAGVREGARTTLDLAIQAAHRDSADVFRDYKRFTVSFPSSRPLRWATFYHDLDLAPGVAQVRVVVRDEASGRVGTVTTRFEIPPLSGLRLATPILTDELRAPLQEGARPQLLIPAHRTFRTTTGSLYCQMQVLGAVPSSPQESVPQVEASYVLRRASGTVVSRGGPSLIPAVPGGPIVRLLGLPLGGLADGDYELVLRALDRTTGNGVERVESFRLERSSGS
jgi:VWFA-related protein